MICGRKPIVLGSEEAGGHYIAVAFEGERVFFDAYHNLCDTKGLVPFAKTVLYLYLKSTAEPGLDADGIRLPGEAFLENETEDPYASLEIPAELRPFYSMKPADAFVMDTRYARSAERVEYCVRVSAPDFVHFFKTNDGSPVVLTSYFLKETVKRLFPDRNGLPICVGVPHSIRQDMLGENNYHDQLMPMMLRCDERTDALPVLTQLTASRGSLLLQMEHDNVLCHARACAALSDEIDALNRAFYLSFLQRDDTELYARTFVSVLRENGIEAELTDSFREDGFRGFIP